MNRFDHPAGWGTRYLRDTIGFETHMRQIRERRGENVPDAWYRRPYFYALRLELEKMRTSGQTIRFPSFVKKKDYEFELVGIFLQGIKTTDIAEAIDHMGNGGMKFCIMNDCSCRDFQKEDSLLPLGVSNSKGIADKSFGTTCAYGRDLGMDAAGVFCIEMELSVNGRPRCQSHFNSIYFKDPVTSSLRNWSFAETITWFGKMNQGFEVGDLLGSGTIGNGCIAERSDIYPWLKHGDEIVMKVDGLGELRNTVEVIEMPTP
ncbi:fumarylacetoacetate hydrolase family protein [Candidatus Kaiserbacteria bacterium]|nr:fumarylacetoacetate hydrolase family protein [Candidatus Kaiserbacteria bacterium]